MGFEQFKKPGDAARTDTKNWYSDRYQTVIVQRNILFVATLAALGCTLLCILLIFFSIPLVTVEPFAIEVDRRSGIVQAVAPLTSRQAGDENAVSDYFLVQYLRARETVNVGDYNFNVNLVRLMSDAKNVFPDFIAKANPYDDKTNYGRLKLGKRNVEIKSIYHAGKDHAQVRFIVEETDPQGNKAPPQHWLADIRYEYRELALSITESFLNPIGFYVTSYELTREAQ